jgi:acyl carrier protein phosphodiesterase
VNYLAHAYLSGDNEELVIGNFIADHLRGNNFDMYPDGVKKGIQLHRRIDSFTDAHPLFKSSKRFFYNGFEKYSGILVDIYFDHFLAKRFHHYHHDSLEVFSSNVYSIYRNNQHLLPESSTRFLTYVLKNNIYQNYAEVSGIETVLTHLSHRIGHKVALNESMGLFFEAEKELETNFTSFMKDIMTYSVIY